MIRSIRGRLQWWYGAVYALSILVFGCLVYWRADRDVNERATLQAVSTAQYLDVSIRNGRPAPMRDGRPMNPPRPDQRDGRPDDVFSSEFPIGQLPPEFQFRPPRDRRPDMGRPQLDRPPLDRPDAGRADKERPDIGPARDHVLDGPKGPPGRKERLEPRLPPDPATNDDGGPRPPIDRMEFAIWRHDGSMLARSDGAESSDFPVLQMPKGIGHPPQITRGNGFIEVAMLGPQEATIVVRRSLEHDMAKLHRFGFQIATMAIGTLVVGIVGGWWISGRIVQPIQMISETAAQISATNLDRRIETRHLDQELVQLGTVLNGTFERLENSFQRLTQFTADASHELRTPLAVIQSQAELALYQPRSAEAYQQTLETCLKSAERMRSLVDGLLLLARTDSDHSELLKETVDLRIVAEDAVALLQEKASSVGIELECATPETMVGVSADVRFLLQVPMNLIDNAIQHSVSGQKIFVEVKTVGNDAVLSVRDTGCGISPEHLPNLFERFYRVDTGRSRQHGGSGLGLSICKSLVEAHGGTIKCEARVGEGSMFTVRLPLVTMG